MSPPPAYEPLGGICVHPHLRQFIDERVLPGTGISADRFWSSLGGIVRELGPKNAELLQKRDTLQASIDEWLRANSSADGAQHASFLKAIGYLAPEFRSSVVTQGIDDEIAHVAGPQLVCPVDNSRFILNAANARWGSLLDAFYGTNAVSSLPGSGQGTYDAARGRAVFDAAHSVLDELFPLSAGVWGDVTALSVENGTLKAAMGSQREATLLAKEQFAGFAAGADDYSSQLSLLLKHNGLHVEILLDRSGKAREHPAGIRDIRIESALSTICDFEDSACTVDAEDKVLAYSNWLGLMDRSLSVPVEKRGRSVERRLEGPRSWTKPNGKGSVNLSSQALLLARNVGMHMYTDMVLTADGTPVPEHFVDAMTTAAAALHDVRAHFLNSRHGSIYIVKPKMHGPEECAFAARLFDAVEQALYLPRNTIKMGVMDEERRTSANLSQTMHEARERLFFVNTGFLDRTADEIHTSMEAGPMLPKGAMKTSAWYPAYEQNNVVTSLNAALVGKGQIGKGMWAEPDNMEAMMAQKGAQLDAGASTAWVPSPVAATLHALHYLRQSVPAVQKRLLTAQRQSDAAEEGNGSAAAARREALLTPPLLRPAGISAEAVRDELENNAQGLLGYTARWVGQGIGCSKVPDLQGVQLMEDRATLRISSQHIANWLRHGVVTEEQVLDTLRRVAVLVDTQNAADGSYHPMAPAYDSPEWHAALELVFDGRFAPNGYTEATLSHWRRARKAEDKGVLFDADESLESAAA